MMVHWRRIKVMVRQDSVSLLSTSHAALNVKMNRALEPNMPFLCTSYGNMSVFKKHIASGHFLTSERNKLE